MKESKSIEDPIASAAKRSTLLSCVMHPRKLQLHRHGARTLLAIAAVLIVGLGGCATELTPRPGISSTEAAPYAGVFTGEFVDGVPLYRFPTIEVVGSRSRAAPGT